MIVPCSAQPGPRITQKQDFPKMKGFLLLLFEEKFLTSPGTLYEVCT